LVVIDNFDACYSRDEKMANLSDHVSSGRVNAVAVGYPGRKCF
jgi:hypothetical protein